MASLFISYSRRDIETARKLTESFKGQDLDFWIDWEGIPPTVDWWKQIEKGIEEADIFLFLISPDSARSKVCRQEIEHAVKNGKRLIPIVVRDIMADESPAELGRLNWIFLRETDDFPLTFRKLITSIKTDYGWAQAHRELQVKALEWERSNHENSFLLRGKELQDGESQLATNSSKEPRPTDLQREYVLRSRQATDRQRRTTTLIATGAAIFMAGLAFFGFVQARLANDRAAISRARELAAQSVSLRDMNFPVSLLLGIEAFKTRDTVQTRGALLDNTHADPRLLAYLSKHTRGINSIAFSPDGNILASGGLENTIILWDIKMREPIGEALKGHKDSIRSLAFSPDGKILASGSNDGTIILWDVATRKPLGPPLIGHTDVIASIVFTPDGKMLASGSADSTILLWRVKTGYRVGKPLRGHTSWIGSLAISPDGKMLASGSEDKTIILWNIETRQPIGQPLKGHTSTVISLAFTPDSKRLASSSDDERIILWDVETGQPIGQPLNLNSGIIHSIAFSPDGKILAAGSNDRTVLLLNVETWQIMEQPLRGHTSFVSTLAFTPDGKTLASSGDDSTIILWDLSSVLNATTEAEGPISQVLREHTEAVNRVVFSSDGKILASASNDGTIILWDAATRKPLGPPLRGYGGVISDLAFTSDGKILASDSGNGIVLLWDVSEALHTSGDVDHAAPRELRGNIKYVSTIAFSPDGKILASGGDDSTIILWDVPTGQPIGRPLKGHTDWAETIAFSPDGKILASGSSDTNLMLWNVATGQSVKQLMNEYHGAVESVVFSPDGKLLASGQGDGVIILWDAKNWQQVGQPLSEHTSFVKSVAFSPDGKVLASGSGDNSIILWDAPTGQPIGQPLAGHAAYVTSVAFSPDGKILASSSFDSTIVLWDIDAVSWMQKTCQRVGRNFTKNEWEKYFPNEEYRNTCPRWALQSEVTPTP
jgi:WD40 repeat protein